MKKKRGRLPHRKLSELLSAAYTVCLLDPTMDKKSLDRLATRARASAIDQIERLGLKRRLAIDYDALGRVVFQWQRLPEYLDQEGNPIPLRIRGRAPSLEALFRKHRLQSYFPVGVSHLQELGLVRKTRKGLLIPKTCELIVPVLTPELVEILAQTLSRLVATVLQNTSLGKPTEFRLIERLTAVPNFPRKDVPAFKKFAQEQGGMVISTMNDWLETRRAEQSPSTLAKERLTAGLHVFAFLDKQ
jgi:hypothetical protein